jgi:hypothetical protein
MRKLLTVLFLIQLLPGSVIPASAHTRKSRAIHYGPEKVTLTGKLVTRTFYGPPNYGEDPRTDDKERQYILLLDSAIDVLASKDDSTNRTERGVTKVTLVARDSDTHPAKSLLGRRVEVEGTLFHATTGHHHTKVLIEVSSLKKARSRSSSVAL